MAFDGIVLNSIVSELNSNIINGKVNKIYEPTNNDIILGLYCNGMNYSLHICTHYANCRIHLSTHAKANPLSAPNFCMLLRKHLIGSKILSINTAGLERIVEINFECYNELNDKIIKKLIIELMGSHSNVILTNQNNIIIDSLKHIDSNNREIMPARHYSYPENSKKDFLQISSLNEFESILKLPAEELDKEISDNFIGISRPFLQYAIKETNSLENLYLYLKNSILNVNNNKLINTNNDFIFSNVSKSNSLENNFFIDDFFFEKEKEETFKELKNKLLKLISANLKIYNKRLENINLKLKECSKMDTYKLFGELLTANLYKIKSNINCIDVLNYYTNETVVIPLDNTISPSKNAEKYFKKYSKLKNTLKTVSIQKKETEQELNYIESIIFSIEEAKSIETLNEIDSEISEIYILKSSKKNAVSKKKTTSNDNYLTYTINGFTVLVGKNNVQNDYLTFKIAQKSDIWFHTKDMHGSHVILKLENKTIDNNTLYKCAELAAKHSKSCNSSNIAVDYTIVKNVKKPGGAKPGMVIYTNYKTLFVN